MKKNLVLFLMILLAGSLYAQSHVSGIVKDEYGEPIPGATIILMDGQDNSTTGSITDINGKYALELSVDKGVLLFSFIGMENQERSFVGNAVINVMLRSSVIGLQEVVAIGYGSQRKASVVGAISTISTKELTQSPAANLGNSLAGRLPGLTIVQTSGQPGADDPKMFIRGRGTWGNSDPLYVVDGIERESITSIDPNEIESISILKDASATAVYGVKGANGVIIVTTRRGTENKPKISFSALFGVQTPTRTPDFLRSYNTAALKNEAILNDYSGGLNDDGAYEGVIFDKEGNVIMSPEDILSTIKADGGFSARDLAEFKRGNANPYYYPDVDWWDEMVRKASPQQQYNLNIRGGSKSARYFVSVGYLTQDGIFKTENENSNFGFNRFNLRSNLDLDIVENLVFSINLAARVEERNLPNGATWNSSGDVFYSINRTAPYETAVINPDGRPGYGVNMLNAWAGMNKTGYKNEQKDVLESSFVFKYDMSKLINGLSLKAQYSYDSDYTDRKNYGEGVMWSNIISERVGGEYDPNNDYDYIYEYRGADEPFNYLGGSTGEWQRSYLDVSAFYDHAFGNHNVTGLLLYNQSDERYGSHIPFRYSGVVSRVTYNFSQRYYAEFNFGANGSENFAPGKRFGYFPAYSIGWMLSEESFIKDNLPVISMLKLRGSYGKVGNDRFGGSKEANRFGYIQNFNATTSYAPAAGAKFGYDAENREYIYESKAANPNITWEKANKMNVGIDVNILNSLISFTGDYFYEKRTDILMQRESIPAYFGPEAPPANIGETENRGFEMELTHRKQLGSFNYWVKGNMSYSENKVIAKDESFYKDAWRRVEGQAIGQYIGYIAEGFFNDWDEIMNAPSQETIGAPHPGDLRYRDINNDNVIDYKDQTHIGRSDVPALVYGFSLGFDVKGIDFSMLFQGAGLSNLYIGDGMMYEFTNKNGKLLNHHLDRWAYYTDPYTGELVDTRATAKYPRLTNDGNNPNQNINSFFLLDNSYLKLRNIEVGYTFNQSLLNNWGVEKVRIYATGNNVYTWTKIKNVDPEGYGNRGSQENYPQLSVYSLGINVTF